MSYLGWFFGLVGRTDTPLATKDSFKGCGIIPRTSKKSSARISNANPSAVHYPWVAYILRKVGVVTPHANVPPTEHKDFFCSGSLITYSYVSHSYIFLLFISIIILFKHH